MGHRGKHMISLKDDMVDLMCSPLSNSQDMGHHVRAHLECDHHHLETIQHSADLFCFPCSRTISLHT
jgi:hypothetical protein